MSIILSYFDIASPTIGMLQKLSHKARELAFVMSEGSQLSVSPLKALIKRAFQSNLLT